MSPHSARWFLKAMIVATFSDLLLIAEVRGTFSTLYYFLRKYKGAAHARAKLAGLRSIVTVLPIDAMVVDQALASRFTNFEDAIQYFTALGSDMDVLVTRNTSDFKQAQLPVNTSEAFLKSL